MYQLAKEAAKIVIMIQTNLLFSSKGKIPNAPNPYLG